MSKEDLLIALLKSNKSHTELLKIDNSNTEIGETKKLFNNLRNNFSREEIKKHREKFHKKEWVYNHLKEIEQKDSLTTKEKRVLKNIEKYFKKLKEDLNKIKIYQYNITRDIGYLFNEITKEDYYEPIEIKSAFDSNYIEYESKGDNNDNLSLEEYLNIIRPYLRDMIDNHKAHSEWKIQLVMKINFISSLGTDEFREMHTKSDNIEIMNGTETSEAINERFKSFLRRYQEGLETKMKGSSFIFERVDLLYYHLHKISLNRAGSYIDSPKWLKTKGATINPKNKNNECFKYAITAALNHEKVDKNPQRITKIEPFIDTYNWKDIKFPSHSNDWKKFEQNNRTIVLKILYVLYNTKQVRPA